MGERLRIVISGLAGLYPVGGVTWDYLQYVLGFDALGHDVYYYEDTYTWPFDPTSGTSTFSPDYTVRYLRTFFERHAPSLSDHWYYRHIGDQAYGMSSAAIDEVLTTADIYLNVSGGNPIPESCTDLCLRVFLDSDPGYNQAVLKEQFKWHPHVERWSASVLAHDVFATYAENIDGKDCLVPSVRVAWIPTRPPVFMPTWYSGYPASSPASWTTVMTWNGFPGEIWVDGVEYGSKNLEFPKIESLPSRLPYRFELAIGGKNTPLDILRFAGWTVREAYRVTATPTSYQEMIRNSRGEISIAKNIYVAMRTGWFSGRSTCYLASGRPVIVQDTGFSSFIPTGTGLFAFATLDESLAAIEEVEANYWRHSLAAREIAHEYFSSDRVLTKLIHDVFAAKASSSGM